MVINDPIDTIRAHGEVTQIEIHPDLNGYLPPVVPPGSHIEHDGARYRVYAYTQFTEVGFRADVDDAPPWTYAHRYTVMEEPF